MAVHMPPGKETLMPAWAVNIIITLIVVIGVIVCINVLADAGAFSMIVLRGLA